MPSSLPINVQQVLQMGTHTEKLQQILQQLPTVTSQQLEEERKQEDEIKRSEIIDPDALKAVNPTDPQETRRRQISARKKEKATENPEQPVEESLSPIEQPQGKNVNLVV